MPPVNPQGSRGGLVAAVVVFTVLFVAATIFAIYYGVQDSKAEDSLVTLNAKFRNIAVDISNPDVSALQGWAKTDANKLPEPTALAEAIHERDALRTMILGDQPVASDQPADTATQSLLDATVAKAQQAVTDANTVLAGRGGKMSAGSLVEAVSDLTTVVNNLDTAARTAIADRDQARLQAAKDSQAARDEQSKADKSVSDAKEQMQQQLDAAADAAKKNQDVVQEAEKTFDDEQRASSTAQDAADKHAVELANQVENLKKQNSGLADKLSGKRLAVSDPIIRRPEGQILSLGDASTVYINLGKGDQIVPGMTFEVYDKTTPLPKLGDGLSEEDLPSGKASIEVTRVLANGSECHVTRIAGGQVIVQGDPILNLIYDRNVKFNFLVYGDFDISRSGHPTATGADVIRRLVVQWGGHLDKTLNIETDFVVMGTPPEIPIYSADDLKDPLNEQNLANAQRAADAYDKVVEEAESLHVPILNQNKFLFFTGYYDLALR
jgi:hypothetical protein